MTDEQVKILEHISGMLICLSILDLTSLDEARRIVQYYMYGKLA